MYQVGLEEISSVLDIKLLSQLCLLKLIVLFVTATETCGTFFLGEVI